MDLSIMITCVSAVSTRLLFVVSILRFVAEMLGSDFTRKFIDRTYLSFKTTIISAAFLVSIQMCALKSFKSVERFS